MYKEKARPKPDYYLRFRHDGDGKRTRPSPTPRQTTLPPTTAELERERFTPASSPEYQGPPPVHSYWLVDFSSPRLIGPKPSRSSLIGKWDLGPRLLVSLSPPLFACHWLVISHALRTRGALLPSSSPIANRNAISTSTL